MADATFILKTGCVGLAHIRGSLQSTRAQARYSGRSVSSMRIEIQVCPADGGVSGRVRVNG